jgi:hypothetical protein
MSTLQLLFACLVLFKRCSDRELSKWLVLLDSNTHIQEFLRFDLHFFKNKDLPGIVGIPLAIDGFLPSCRVVSKASIVIPELLGAGEDVPFVFCVFVSTAFIVFGLVYAFPVLC